jgi:DNA-binding IclR family transcriptional regulator
VPQTLPQDALGLLLEPERERAYASTRRVFRIIDRISREGERLRTKELARDLGVSASTCYHLLSLLAEEGYIERLPGHAGYRLGPTIGVLHERLLRAGLSAAVDPALRALGDRAGCPAYYAVLQDDDVLVTYAYAPPESPRVGVPEGFIGPSHALALGKVLIASGGVREISRYVESRRLETYTRRTITDPVKLEAHLKDVRVRGFATDFEEFAKNLYCVAVPVRPRPGDPQGAIGLGTTSGRKVSEIKHLIRLAQSAAREITGGTPRET